MNFVDLCNLFACAHSNFQIFGLETEHLFYVALPGIDSFDKECSFAWYFAHMAILIKEVLSN